MQNEGKNSFGYTVVLGENRFEQFQILLDGDVKSTFYPGEQRAPSGASVMGPSPAEDAEGMYWLVDGRPETREPDPDSGILSEANAPAIEALVGFPGDKYRITMHMRGKWRTVVWEKLPDPPVPYPPGEYFIVGAWSKRGPEKMTLEDADSGLHTIEVCPLDPEKSFFYLVRNRDAHQIFYPDEPFSEPGESDIMGPDEDNDDSCWNLAGAAGSVFRIQFRRKWEDGEDKRVISASIVGHRTREEEKARRQAEKEVRAEERRAREEREAEELEAMSRR